MPDGLAAGALDAYERAGRLAERDLAADVDNANLPAFLVPRHYVLEVEASGAVGTPVTLRHPFRVRPAWWRSWWAHTWRSVRAGSSRAGPASVAPTGNTRRS